MCPSYEGVPPLGGDTFDGERIENASEYGNIEHPNRYLSPNADWGISDGEREHSQTNQAAGGPRETNATQPTQQENQQKTGANLQNNSQGNRRKH